MDTTTTKDDLQLADGESALTHRWGLALVWTETDALIAAIEGWGLFPVFDDELVEIQRLDMPVAGQMRTWSNDFRALEWVRARAIGVESETHRKAIEMHEYCSRAIGEARSAWEEPFVRLND